MRPTSEPARKIAQASYFDVGNGLNKPAEAKSTMVDTKSTMVYYSAMYEILKSSAFDAWLRSLRHRDAKARIEVRIRRLSLGNPGQFRSLKNGINELKIDCGPGYRVYSPSRARR